MASRIGNGGGQPFIPPPGLSTDNRTDQSRERMIKELAEMELARTQNEGAAILDHVVTVLRRNRLLDASERVQERVRDAERPAPTQQAPDGRTQRGQQAENREAGRPPPVEDVGRLVAEFQRQNGLPVTGRLDRETVGVMREQGVLNTQPAPSTTQPTDRGRNERAEPAPRAQPRPEDREAARRLTTIAEQAARARIDGGPPRQPPTQGAQQPPQARPPAAPAQPAPPQQPPQARPPDAATRPQPAQPQQPPAQTQPPAATRPQPAQPQPAQPQPVQPQPAQQARPAQPPPPPTNARPTTAPVQPQQPQQPQRPQATERPTPVQATPDAQRADPVIDPSRLIASLFNAGFLGKKALEEGVKNFQQAMGLPVTGKLDPATQETLASHNLIDKPEAAPPKDKPVAVDKPKETVRRALQEAQPTSRTQADRDVTRDPIRPQAPTAQPQTSADVSARAPVTAPAPTDVVEKMRLDTVLATQQATERGVQEATGDPTATQGHGEVAGQGQGVKGKGGEEGGGVPDLHPSQTATAATHIPDELALPVGGESAVANAHAGDDNFSDDERGHANFDDGSGNDEEGHYRVPALSEQVRVALEKILRDDDGLGAVTYSWDITFYRPGIYAPGQPAQEIWRIVVEKANAFDDVWQQAQQAIATKMLYMEPDATPPSPDDFTMALRRARVRDPSSDGSVTSS